VPSMGKPFHSFGPVQPLGVRRTIIGQMGCFEKPVVRAAS
jgi:hypothetical protein